MFHIVLITPEKTLYDAVVESFTCQTEEGEITLLANHIDAVIAVKAGEAYVVHNGEHVPLVVGQGVLNFDKNTCTVLINTAEHVDQIDEERAREALKRAKEYVDTNKNALDRDYARMQGLIERNLARIRGLERWRK
jgi:F-type H+-transporting ATPase subunit epsilon